MAHFAALEVEFCSQARRGGNHAESAQTNPAGNRHRGGCRPDNIADVPTCRNNDVPYEKGYTYTVTVDGFIVSDNVKATAQNIDTGFEFSDHNPVLLTFELL